MNESEPLQFVGANEVLLGRRKLIYFSGCDYFRLARDPRLAIAARKTLAEHGLNVAASRRTTGNHPIYTRLELELAKFFGAESALLLPDGYLAPIAGAQALAGEVSVAFIDEFAHGALVDAARMLDCPIKKFRHRDPDDLGKQIAKCGRKSRPIVLTDGLFAHDGSVAPLREYLKVLPRGGILLVDDCHGAGVLGVMGKGTLEFAGVGRGKIIQCATLSKAFGSYGGVVLASRTFREKMLACSRSFIGTTPLPLPLAGAALAAIEILRQEPARRERLFENLIFVRTRLRAVGWDVADAPGPIVRLPDLDVAETAALKSQLLAAGIYPPFVKYSAASAHGIFRFVVSSEHSPAHRCKLVEVLAAFQARAAGKFSADTKTARTRRIAPRRSLR